MKLTCIALVAATASILSYADSSPTAKRDKALETINACLRSNEVSSRQCKKLKENVETLVEVYRGGDKTVLPTLFRFAYLTDFYDDALLADPDGFLTAMNALPEKDQKAVELGISGGMFGLRSKERFEAIRALLAAIPDSEPTRQIAHASLKTLERINASFFLTYFPPQTFTSRAAAFQVRWYSRDMYALGERPIWPASSNDDNIYRFTYLPAFTDPTVVTLMSNPDGTGRITIKAVTGDRETTRFDETAAVPLDELSRFVTLLDQAHFPAMPTELPSSGLDGAEWILESVHSGKYHIVVRWCPDIDRQSAAEGTFADAGRLLFKLAGHKHGAGC